MTSRPQLKVFNGNGSSTGERRSLGLTPLTKTVRIEPYQLHFQMSGLLSEAQDRAIVISVGIGDFVFDEFISLMSSWNVKRVIDIRLSNSFHEPGFSYEKFILYLSRLGIKYRHELNLANRFLGDSFDEQEILARYKKYLSNNQNVISMLKTEIQSGPIALLGWSYRQNETSEQDVLISVLRDNDPKFEFDIHIAKKDKDVE